MTRAEREALLAVRAWHRAGVTGVGRFEAEYALGLAAVALEVERRRALALAGRARRTARAAPRAERPRLRLTEVSE